MNTAFRSLSFCFLLAFLAAVQPLSAQEGQGDTGLAKLDAASRFLTSGLVQTLRTLPRQNGKYRLQLGSFTLNGEQTALGAVWANNLATFLASAAAAPGANITLTLQDAPQADFLVQGEIVPASDTIRVYTRLIRVADGTLAKGIWSDLAIDPVLASLVVPAGASEGTARDIHEPDSRDSPLAVNPGDPSLERTLHSGDEDWFLLRIPGNGILIVQTGGGMDTLMSLYAQGSTTSLQEDDDSGEDGNARIEYPVSAGDTVLASVSGYDGETGSYSFSAELEPLPARTEQNDTQARAVRLSLDGESRRMIFDRQDDIDWFSFMVPSTGGVLQLTTTGGLDMLVELYDAAGTKVAEDDDSGEDGNARLSRQLPGGQYFVKLYEYEGKAGIYRLEARLVQAGPPDQYEPDDSMESARPIRPGSPQRRNFNHPGDTDWAVLELARAGSYAIAARPPRDNGLDTYIELYDAAGQLLDEDDDGGRNMDAYLEAELGPGRYYIKVWQLDGEVPGDGVYELAVTTP
jgi:hypothetical protein